ncbi:Fic family protein [Haloferula chungangensis]|uniref:Fic family protein n=1 Tax=Haloferula chungangensis TaxID=1048331 RepID=A0ABW2L9N5_9BACT
MRYPNIAPDWTKILPEVTKAGLGVEFFKFGQEEGLRTDRYLHWDEFRHRASKTGPLAIEQRWAAIRMARSLRAQPIALIDTSGKPFTFSLTQRAFELLHEIDLHCGGGIGVAQDGVIQADTRDNYYITSIFEEALTSSQLEGAVVTRSEAREIIRKQRQPANSHERMVVNNYRTMRLVSDLKEQELTPELILSIHREITAGTLDHPGDEGRFRDLGDDVRVVDDESGETFHTPPPASQLAGRMDALCTFANQQGMNGFLHPVIRSILIHFWVAYDHPFVDGNGRTARALFYWSMLRHGFWLAEFFSISHEILKAPKKYYRAFLYTETDDNDLNYFLLHQLEVIKSSISALKEYILRKQTELDGMRKHLGPGAGFNHRQLAILKHAMKFPYASYTVAGHQESHGTSYQTANNDLAQLHQRGLLHRKKVSKAFVFNPVPDLAKRLGNPGEC